MSISIGTQLVAPEGFDALCKGVTYYFLWSDRKRQRVLLVYFIQRPRRQRKKGKRKKWETPPPMARLVAVRLARFESAVLDNAIRLADVQRDLPPWLDGLDVDVESLDEFRSPKRKTRHKDRIDNTLSHIGPLIKEFRRILSAEDPERELNKHARACSPQQNESLHRLHFFVYLAFRRNRNALAYPVHRIGRWDRMQRTGKKFGRGSKDRGRNHGHGSNDPKLLEDVYDGYRKFGLPGVPMSEVARLIKVHIWKCRAVIDAAGYKTYIQPDGKPFLNTGQIVYRIIEHFGLENVKRTLLGKARHRKELVASLGPFSEAVANAMERTEADGYWAVEVARGPISGSHLPPLVVVRIRDVATGMIVGIGFSLGGETGAAYRMAQFCMAICKVKFCDLFGVKIAKEDWPCEGISPDLTVDRGPGSSSKADASSQEARPVFSGMAPAGQGQSKATIESSNPRHIHISDKPSFVETDLPLIHLARREIFRAVSDCDSINVADRLTHRLIAEGTKMSPLGLWNALSKVGRNDAIPLGFDAAVRAFLTPTSFKLGKDGVYLEYQRFDSPALRATGLLDTVRADQDVPVRGYVLDMALRHAWVEVKGALIEVHAMHKLRDDREQLYVSVLELQQLAEMRAEGLRRFREHADAVKGDIRRRFEENTGKTWNAGKRKSGRPKRGTQAARDEARSTKNAVHPGRKAA